MEITTYLSERRRRVEDGLARFMLAADGPFREHIESMRYSLFVGGKRLRPILCLAGAEAVDEAEAVARRVLPVACALECIHTYSLIHDDLPAMDDDDLRRGKPSNHRQFDEATAILAGDSLFLDPFGLLAAANLPAPVLVDLVQALSAASGTFGMVGGQVLDMKGEGQVLNLDQLSAIHANKTGRLLAFPFEAAGIIAQQSKEVRQQLLEAGRLVGHAFQVRDDILDLTASFEEIGKTPKKDLLAEKSTYPSLLGLEKSYEILEESLHQAQAIFKDLQQQVGFAPEKILEMLERLRLDA